MSKKYEVWEILRNRYPSAEYALMAEVRDAAGFGASRSADYIVMNLWPSRGLHLSGIELKASRTDWLKELKSPAKAENIFMFCDFFWLLTYEKDAAGNPLEIAKPDEIPQNWGWMSIVGGKIRIKKDAPKLNPQPIDRDFLAAMLKRACDKSEFIHVKDIEDRITKARENGRNEAKTTIERQSKDLGELRRNVDDFRKASGIDLLDYHRWSTNPTKMGQAVKFLEHGGAESVRKELVGLKGIAEQILSKITTNIEALEQISKPT